MKSVFKSFVLVLSILLGQAQAATISLNSSATSVAVGSTLDISIIVDQLFANATADELLLAFGFNAQSSNSSLLQLTGTTIHSSFSDNSSVLGLSASGFAFPGIPYLTVNNNLTLATLHFLALAPGQVTIEVTTDLQDFNQGLIFLNQNPQSIHANGQYTVVNAVPVPSAVWLFCSGLLTISLKRKQAI